MKLFVDDLRDPPKGWVVARTSFEAINLLKSSQYIEAISLDHDLGGEDTAMRVAHKLIEMDMNEEIDISSINITVHSANPVGKANLEGLLKSYLRYKS